jgi:hypothetical protein
MVSKRKRANEESSDSEGNCDLCIGVNAITNLKVLFPPDQSEETGLDEAALHTIWDTESAKEILQIIAKKPGLTVFTAI